MKVHVNVSSSAGIKGEALPESMERLDLVVNPFDTVLELKQRIATAISTPFPIQDLLLGKIVLDDGARLGDCNVKDGSTLSLSVQVSEDIFLKQLEALLQERPLSLTELSLLYCHRHGATVGEALEQLGCPFGRNLLDFLLKSHGAAKRFTASEHGGLVSLVKESNDEPRGATSQKLKSICEEAAQPQPVDLMVTVLVIVQTVCGAQESEVIELKVSPVETVRSVKDRAAAAELVPFPEQELLLDGQPLDDTARLADCGVTSGAALQLLVRASEYTLVSQLAGLLQGRALSVTELSQLYCYRYGTNVNRALKLLGAGKLLKEFLNKHDAFCVDKGCVTLAPEDGPPSSCWSWRQPTSVPGTAMCR